MGLMAFRKPDCPGKDMPHTVLSGAFTMPHILWSPVVLVACAAATKVCFSCYRQDDCKVLELRFASISATELCKTS
jgi:hypothetical protein